MQVGKIYKFRSSMMSRAFTAELVKINENSLVVRVVDYHEEDTETVRTKGPQIVVPKNSLLEECSNVLVLHKNNVEVVVSQKLNFEPAKELRIKGQFASVGAGLMRQMGSPDYLQIQIDTKRKLLFLVPCKKDALGARKCPKSKVGTPITMQFIIKQVVEWLPSKEKRYGVDIQQVDGLKHALGFDFNKVKEV